MLIDFNKMIDNFSPDTLFSSKHEELERLKELYELNILDSPQEEEFDDITRIVSFLFNMPVVLISLVSEDRQWFKSCVGITFSETEREVSFCQHVVAEKEALIVNDSLLDDRFKHNPLVEAYNIRFYAGAPLVTQKGNIIGTLCLIDETPRTFTDDDLTRLNIFANMVVSNIEKRRKLELLDEHQNRMLDLNKKYYDVVNNVSDIVFQTDINGFLTFLSESWERVLGYSKQSGMNHSLLEYVHSNDRHLLEVITTSLYSKVTKYCEQELRFLNSNGEIVWLRGNFTSTIDRDGVVVNINGTLTDISDLKKIQLEKEIDMQLAKNIQQTILSSPIEEKNISIKGKSISSLDLSGDLYFWCKIDQSKYGVILIDVMGHGVSSCLVSMGVRSILRELITRKQRPIEVVQELNQHMNSLVIEGVSSYYTAIYLLIDTEKKSIEYVNAGHPSGVALVDHKGKYNLDKGCPPIGILETLSIEKGKISYTNNTKIILYTDGLFEIGETMSPEDNIYKCLDFAVNVDKDLPSIIMDTYQIDGKIPDDLTIVSIELEG